MKSCLKCGNGAVRYPFRVLEVQTLHVRDITGEKRVQALGLFQEYGICQDCARHRLDAIREPGRVLWKQLLPFAVIFVLGAVLTVIFWSGEGGLRLLGLAGLVCGVLGFVDGLKGSSQRRKEYAALSDEAALARAAWECLLDSAPKKDGENDLTYIPVNERTLAMKNGDLMIEYELLPEIAVKAYGLLHERSQ